MQVSKTNKPSFLKQVLIFEAIIFIVLLGVYTHRLSTVDILYVKTSLNENSNQIKKNISDYLEKINGTIKKAAVQIVKDPANITKSIEAIRRRSPRLPIKEISWLGAEDRYMTLSGIDHYLNRNIDESLIRRAIETPWTMIVGGDKDGFMEGIQATFSVTGNNGRYLGSFLLLLDVSAMRKALNETMHMDRHPELSYALFSSSGDVIVSSCAPGDIAFLQGALDDEALEKDVVLALPNISMLGFGRSYQIKNIHVLGREYKIVMMIDHQAAFGRSIRGLGFMKWDLLMLCGICIYIFIFIRYRFMVPIARLSRVANMVDPGNNKIYTEDYTAKELSDLSDGIQSLITKQHKLIDYKNRLGFALKQLEVLKQERMEFARNIQHTLRTPIGHIIGGSEVLLSQFMKKVSPDAKEYLSMINESSQELLAAVNNIIAASDLKAGNIELNEVNCDIKKIIEAVVDDLSARVGQSQISLNTNIANLPTVYMDPIWFGTAIFNIVDNAIKFCKVGGEVDIVAKRTAAGVMVVIEDTGHGMSEAQLRSIEELFNNASASNNITAMQKGVGLGLTIAHHILDLHDATLSIESTEGVGTKVIITIPNIRIK